MIPFITMKVRSIISFLILFSLTLSTGSVPAAAKGAENNSADADICIYGGTSAGVIAAYTAIKQGKKVILIEPTDRIGGLTAGGLGFTDIGNPGIIRGYALDFYRRVGRLYGKKEPVYKFEPKVALSAFEQYVRETDMHILYGYRIVSARKHGGRVESITLESAASPRKPRRKIRAKVFIDCSYEGDLMARSGISYTVGREDCSVYGEKWNGVQMLTRHQFPDGVDPYRVKGDPKSGLLWGIMPGKPGAKGSGDRLVQAYNIRVTLTDDTANIIPITKPDNYDPSHYELLIRLKEVSPWKKIDDCFAWDMMPGRKTDINNKGGFSTDMIGWSSDYPEASYKKRARIAKAHEDYTKGLLYFVGHDPRIPEQIRREMLRWGYPKDEYLSHGHFSPQLYIRESRRMVGAMVMTESNCMGRTTVSDPIGQAAYTMDSHNAGRYVVNGMVKNEGNVEEPVPNPYGISYRAITPKRQEAVNVLVPVCLSASHIAYGSIRMEPVFMVLGESAALAASNAIDLHSSVVQDVDASEVMRLFNKLAGE